VPSPGRLIRRGGRAHGRPELVRLGRRRIVRVQEGEAAAGREHPARPAHVLLLEEVEHLRLVGVAPRCAGVEAPLADEERDAPGLGPVDRHLQHPGLGRLRAGVRRCLLVMGVRPGRHPVVAGRVEAAGEPVEVVVPVERHVVERAERLQAGRADALAAAAAHDEDGAGRVHPLDGAADPGLPAQHRVRRLGRVAQLARMRLVHDLVADDVGIVGVAGGDHAGKGGVVGLRAGGLGREEGRLGVRRAAPRRGEAAAGVVPVGHAARPADGLARLAGRLREVGRPVELVEVDQHVDVHRPERGDDPVELPERLRVPAVVAVPGRLGLDRVPADVDAGHVRAQLLGDGSEVRHPDRHVESVQDHRPAALVDELAGRRRHPRLDDSRRLAGADRRSGWRQRAGADAAVVRGTAAAAPGRQDQRTAERREGGKPHRPNARRRAWPEGPAAFPRRGAPSSVSVAPSRL